LNFFPTEKILFLFIVTASIIGNAGSTLYLPALLSIGQDLNASPTLMKLSLSFYLITFGLSQIFYGPLSDAFGRRINLIIGLTIFFLGSLLSSFATTIHLFLAARLIQGIGIGTSSAVGFAFIRDIFEGQELIKHLSYLSVFVGMTPIIAPLFGGYLTEYLGWRSCFISLSLLSLFLIIGKTLFLPETNIHLNKKACHPKHILKNFQFLLKSPLFLGFILVTAIAFSSLMTINTLLPLLITKSLHLSPSIYGWLSICSGGGYFIGAYVSSKLGQKFSKLKIILAACFIQLTFILIALVLSLFFFTVSALIMPLTATLFGIGLIVPISSSGALEPFPKMAGSEAALLGASMFSISSLFTALASLLSEKTQIPLFLFLLGLTLISFPPLFLLKKEA